jgi:NADH-quinone oxidoreductase subunit J
VAIIQQAEGAVAPIARPLFTSYLLAFEVTSVLLLVAVVGAVVVGRRRGDEGPIRVA